MIYRRCTLSLLFTLCAVCAAPPILRGDENPETSEAAPAAPFESFTGKAGRDKVRLRLHPSLESHIVRELSRGEPLAVVGEEDEFYSIRPPADTEFYVFRTYVLDDVIEANRVNVRLEPSTESPIVAQLNAGDVIEGHLAADNHKWYAIKAPENTVFWVAKDYIEHVGPPNLFAELQERRANIQKLFAKAGGLQAIKDDSSADPSVQYEALEEAIAALQDIIKNYTDFPESVKKAKHLLVSIEEESLEMKLAHYEKKRHDMSYADKKPAKPSIHKEPTLKETPQATIVKQEENLPTFAYDTHKPSPWKERELKFYHAWQGTNPDSSIDDFYQTEINQAVVLHGIIEPYEHLVKNKPGDYVLVNVASRLPIGYLYSNHLPLENLVGREVTIKVTERPNNHFAFPAFYVLAVE